MKWYFQSCSVDNNGKSREISTSLKKTKPKNQQMLSEIQPTNSESRDEQNLKTTTQITLKIITSPAEVIDHNVFG